MAERQHAPLKSPAATHEKETLPCRGETTQVGILDVLNYGLDDEAVVSLLDRPQKCSTKVDQQDMFRLGKEQELKVRVEIVLVS
jgi:hypothetical protein